MYCELCGSTTHTAKQCHSLDALANILDFSTFRIDEAPQGFGDGQRGEGASRGGRDSGIGPTHYYNFDEQGHPCKRIPTSEETMVHTVETIPILLRTIMT
jgi:hypothetical protein